MMERKIVHVRTLLHCRYAQFQTNSFGALYMYSSLCVFYIWCHDKQNLQPILDGFTVMNQNKEVHK